MMADDITSNVDSAVGCVGMIVELYTGFNLS